MLPPVVKLVAALLPNIILFVPESNTSPDPEPIIILLSPKESISIDPDIFKDPVISVDPETNKPNTPSVGLWTSKPALRFWKKFPGLFI